MQAPQASPRPRPPHPRGHALAGPPPPAAARPRGLGLQAPAPAHWRRGPAPRLRLVLAHVALGELAPPSALLPCPPATAASVSPRPGAATAHDPRPASRFPVAGAAPPPPLPRPGSPSPPSQPEAGTPRPRPAPPHRDTRGWRGLFVPAACARPPPVAPRVSPAPTPCVPSASRSSPRPGGSGRLLGVRGRAIGGFFKSVLEGGARRGGRQARSWLWLLLLLRFSLSGCFTPRVPRCSPRRRSPELGSARRRNEGAGAQDPTADRYHRPSPPATVLVGARAGSGGGGGAARVRAGGGVRMPADS